MAPPKDKEKYSVVPVFQTLWQLLMEFWPIPPAPAEILTNPGCSCNYYCLYRRYFLVFFFLHCHQYFSWLYFSNYKQIRHLTPYDPDQLLMVNAAPRRLHIWPPVPACKKIPISATCFVGSQSRRTPLDRGNINIMNVITSTVSWPSG